jgi:hypothetical protein
MPLRHRGDEDFLLFAQAPFGLILVGPLSMSRAEYHAGKDEKGANRTPVECRIDLGY